MSASARSRIVASSDGISSERPARSPNARASGRRASASDRIANSPNEGSGGGPGPAVWEAKPASVENMSPPCAAGRPCASRHSTYRRRRWTPSRFDETTIVSARRGSPRCNCASSAKSSGSRAGKGPQRSRVGDYAGTRHDRESTGDRKRTWIGIGGMFPFGTSDRIAVSPGRNRGDHGPAIHLHDAEPAEWSSRRTEILRGVAVVRSGRQDRRARRTARASRRCSGSWRARTRNSSGVSCRGTRIGIAADPKLDPSKGRPRQRRWERRSGRCSRGSTR